MQVKVGKNTKETGRRNPARARHGLEKMLSDELEPEDAFVFLGKDISKQRYAYYQRKICGKN